MKSNPFQRVLLLLFPCSLLLLETLVATTTAAGRCCLLQQSKRLVGIHRGLTYEDNGRVELDTTTRTTTSILSSTIITSTQHDASRISLFLQGIRGGGVTDEDDEDDDDSEVDIDDNDDDSSSDATVDIGSANSSSGDILDVYKQVVNTVTKMTVETTMALTRVIQSAFQSGKDVEAGQGGNIVWQALQRLWFGIFSPKSKPSLDQVATDVGSFTHQSSVAAGAMVNGIAPNSAEKKKQKSTRSDFGTYLAESYGVDDARISKAGGTTNTTKQSVTPFLGGTLAHALRVARSQASLLVVFVPAASPLSSSSSKRGGGGGGNTKTPDQEAIQSLLSKKAISAAKKNSIKNERYGSFVFWGAKAGSPEATAALNQLKAKPTKRKGEKRPVLLVAYPKQLISSIGEPKLTPVTLAQHHCSPPPSAESLAKWLNALRKRHAKEYSVMQVELREVQLYQERQQGYRESVSLDVQRQETERKQKADRIAKEKAEKEHVQAIEQRRKELQSSLPPEPTSPANVVTIALRFADGRTGQRKFAPTTALETVFNWVDAMYEMERETVTLSTMNGQKTFAWQDCGKMTLEEAGIGRMTGLRVLQTKPDTPVTSQPAASTS